MNSKWWREAKSEAVQQQLEKMFQYAQILLPLLEQLHPTTLCCPSPTLTTVQHEMHTWDHDSVRYVSNGSVIFSVSISVAVYNKTSVVNTHKICSTLHLSVNPCFQILLGLNSTLLPPLDYKLSNYRLRKHQEESSINSFPWTQTLFG